MLHSSRRAAHFILRCAVLGLAIAFILSVFAPDWVGRLRGDTTAPRATTAATIPVAARLVGPVSYADAVTRAAPAVVNIYANKITTVRQYRIVPDPLAQRLFGAIAAGPPYKKREQSLGSGVIFSADGYVLTNNHVISGADDIQILLFDGRVSQARVIGTDQDTDLAVLKIDVADLPTIAIAESDTVTVGDVVLAIGNPFGIGKTVTMGIVSGTGRQLRLSEYEDFIQTDAAINSGNSGGALVNALGELVGINTAVFWNSGGNGRSGVPEAPQGIGFAIPVATAKAVLEQIVRHGLVIRGSLGVEYADNTLPGPNGIPSTAAGVIVLEVESGGAASSAGIHQGDVLLKLDGNDIRNQADLRSQEAAIAPGTLVRVEGVREGLPFTLDVTLGQRRARTAGS
ncbi:MAG: trypsin-like peptidase domain-containing protein [Xanthomonadales bacterium]|nr:trypsin-like peptidase domain-containing protein [Xanthomonadales bacterium]